MAVWQLVHGNSERERVLAQSPDWQLSRKAFAEVLAGRCKAERSDAVRHEHYRLTRFRVQTLPDGSEFTWLGLDAKESLALVLTRGLSSEFGVSRRARRRISQSVSDATRMQAEPPSVETAVRRASEEGPASAATPDTFMGEPASISLLDSGDS